MAALCNRAGHYIFILWFFLLLSSSLFPRLISAVADCGCLPYCYTWCGLSANLECRSEMCCTRLAGNAGRKNVAKKSQSAHHRTNLSGCIFATKACIDNQKKLVKQQYVLHLFSQYGELRPTNAWDRFRSLVHPLKFQRVSRLGFVTAATSLTGGQRDFARCLAVSSAGTLYIHFRGLPDGILPGAKFTLVQVLRSPILEALLHGTSAAAVSQTLRRSTTQGTFAEGAIYIRLGGHYVGHRPTF